MNCKPGDIARIVHPSMYGTLVEILHEQPVGWYKLPDGHDGFGSEPNGWVFEFLSADAKMIPIMNGTQRATRYAACHDRWLRPIRGGESPEKSAEAMRLLTQIPKKDKVAA